MKIGKKREFKKCPRCGNKVFKTFENCGNCGLNFNKLAKATNYEGKQEVYKNEKERVVWTNQLPSDLNKWNLFFMALFLGWAGVHLFQVGKLGRAISHVFGLVLGGAYIILLNVGELNVFWYNFGNIAGAFWLVTFVLSVIDIFEIAFNKFKVPVSLPYKEN